MQQEMKYIYTVYQKGSFSKAARALYMTQPALSIAVQRVEREIGMPLFRRDHQPLELTEAGKVYIAKIQEIQFLEHQLEQQLGDLSQLKTGCLRIGGTHYFNSYVLPPVLAEYQRHWPGIQVELTEAGSGELISLLKENLIDLTFNCTPDPRDSCHRIPAFRDQVLIAVPVDFPVSGSLSACPMTAEDILNGIHRTEAVPAVSAADLAEIPFLLLTSGNNLPGCRCLTPGSHAGHPAGNRLPPLLRRHRSRLHQRPPGDRSRLTGPVLPAELSPGFPLV